MILNMKGRPISQAPEGECIVTGEVNMEELKSFRDYFIVAKDWD